MRTLIEGAYPGNNPAVITITLESLVRNYPKDWPKGIFAAFARAASEKKSVVFKNMSNLFSKKNMLLSLFSSLELGILLLEEFSTQEHKLDLTAYCTCSIDLPECVLGLFEIIRIEKCSLFNLLEKFGQLQSSFLQDGFQNSLNINDLTEISNKLLVLGYGVEEARNLYQEAVSTLISTEAPQTVSKAVIDEVMSRMYENNTGNSGNKVQACKWSEIGGYEDVKLRLEESVIWFYTKQDIFKQMGIVASKGTLLYGPPGNGKTMFAKSIASESGANFYPISMSALVKGTVGKSEKQIAALFETAKRTAPSVIFIDEMESLFGVRDNCGDLAAKVYSQLAYEMDEMEGVQSQVVLLAATNFIHMIDPGLLRAGRIDRHIYLGNPTLSDCMAILLILFDKISIQVETGIDLDLLAESCVGCSGSQLNEIVRRSALFAVQTQCPITCDIFEAARLEVSAAGV